MQENNKGYEQDNKELFLDRIQLTSAIIQKTTELIGWKKAMHLYYMRNKNRSLNMNMEESNKYAYAWASLIELFDFLEYKDFNEKEYKDKDLQKEIKYLKEIVYNLETNKSNYPKYEDFIKCFHIVRKVVTLKGYLNTEMFNQGEKIDWGSLYDEI